MIVVDALAKRFGTTLALDGLSFTARPGRVTALLGPNGAGKTTTLRILLGLAGATSGTATFDGVRYADLEDPLGTTGAVVEESTFHPGRTARTHLRALALAAGLPPGRPDEVLGLVELSGVADRRVRHYSLGMRQRLSIAAALLGDPAHLVLDEPQNGLDPRGTRWLRGLLRTLAAEGRTVLVSSHLLAEMAEIADDVVVVAGGRLVRQAGLDELTAGRSGLEDVFLQLTDEAEGEVAR
ncbi:MAG: ABC transporter ATP-binding protein [Mycobacteriales bacterium]